MPKLTNKQKTFVREYLIDLNAAQAAIRAGYSKKTARKIGQENLTKPDIQALLHKAMRAREQRTEITQDRVLRELARIAFSSGTDFAKVVTESRIQEYLDPNTGELTSKEITIQTVVLEDTESLSDDKKAAISCIKETKNGLVVESCDKLKALELIGRHLGMYVDKSQIDINVPVIFAGEEKLED